MGHDDQEVTGIELGASVDHGAKLVVVVGGAVREYVLPPQGSPLMVGRTSSCQIQIDAQSVSRLHARILPVDEGYLVQDLGSKNGTWVNGQRLGKDPFLVHPGDALRFGHVVAQLGSFRPSRILLPRLLRAADFDQRLLEEGERCVRYDRSLVLVAIDVGDVDEAAAGRLATAVLTQLRALDVATSRSGGRVDVLLAECAIDEAREIGKRLHQALAAAGFRARLGIAGYPADVGSTDVLTVAAHMAMLSVADDGIELAGSGIRTIQLGEREIIIAEPTMARLFGLVERVANGNAPALVVGETGSGKEIIAEAIHMLGPRRVARLVKLNCAALPEHLLESELFGHEKGAFTGAAAGKAGLFEEADGGTLFLDEIGEMAPSLQAKLLRVLEDKKVRRVGSNRERVVDVRFVAATHRDLRAMVAEGRFREDLYYRLGVVVLRVPPLRERRREIGLLAQRFALSARGDDSAAEPPFAPEVARALESYAWPGNIRELRNVVAGAMMLAGGGTVQLHDLPAEVAAAGPIAGSASASAIKPAAAPVTVTSDAARDRVEPLEEELRRIERERIVEALRVCGGNQTRAAEYLQMPRRTLVRKLAMLGIRQRDDGAT